MRNLSFDQLRTFETVVELASFTAASRRLNLSQSAVSTQIKELEERLGVRLIDRLGKRAHATDAGRQVILHSRRIGLEVQSIMAIGQKLNHGWLGKVRLGAGPNILAYLLPPILKRLRETEPSLDVTIRTGTTRDMVAMVLANDLDLAVVTLPVDNKLLIVENLRTDQLVAVLPAETRNVPPAVTPRYLASHPLILDGRSRSDRMSRDWLRAAGENASPIMELSTPEAIRNVVAAGLGVTILGPECVADTFQSGVLVRPLLPPLMRTIAIVQRRDKLDDQARSIICAALRGLAAPVRPGPVQNRNLALE
jgi:DNA-binding transcriptional LysR family regulator